MITLEQPWSLPRHREAIASLPYGKRLPTAVYILESENAPIPEDLRRLLHTLRTQLDLSSDFNILKLSTATLKLSFLSYPTFFEEPHPALHKAVSIDLAAGTVRRSDYRTRPGTRSDRHPPNSCASLIEGLATGDLEADAKLAHEFWEAVAHHFPAWAQVREGRMPTSEVREGYLHSHGIALQAIGKAGNALLKAHPKDWRKRLAALEKIDWSRANASLWEGRALIGGKVSKVNTNVVLITNVIKQALGLALGDDEAKIKQAHRRMAA